MTKAPKPRFTAGDHVVILDLAKPGHVRTPLYVRGKAGTVERYCGVFENPEDRAYGRVGLPEIALYRIRLPQKEIWPDYEGSAADTLEIEVYEHWLAPLPPGRRS